ncbi:MRN complex-interacting protein isoform X2 [Panthera tigris]|uniref:MRN complex-interacting protein isoform X2 n=1 Tax=Panthera tigris TaxID=9694 RepID=UPI001C6F8A72|nr:MRN complex-interacting protein isoform X2 [Panthera tigris]
MAAPQRFRVLRCYSCRAFQSHQEKKSLKWTCKACGEKQSFLRTYGEGSGADCRRHVQKLNLLQGQISEMSLRSLEEPVNIDEEDNAEPQQAEHEKPQSSENCWLKYLEGDSEEQGMEGGGVYFKTQPLSRTEKTDPPFNTGLPRKRKWIQSTDRPPHSPDVWNPSDSEIPLEPQKDHTGLMGKVKDKSSHKDWGTRELFVPQGDPPQPTHRVRTMPSKWERFLQPPGNSQCVDMKPPVPLNSDPRPAKVALAEQGTLRAQTPREGYISKPHDAPELLWLTHTLTSGSQRPCVKTTKQPWDTNPLAKGGSLATGAQEPPLVQLCDLFKTGEDFEDHL